VVDIQQDGHVHILVDALKVAHDDIRHDRVQGGDRFIREDDGRVLVQGPGQGDTLLLAARQLIAAGVGLVQDADFIQSLEGFHFLFFGVDAEQHLVPGHVRNGAGQDVADDRGACDQVEGLEDHADFAAELPQALPLEGHDIDAVHQQLAGGDIDHAVDGADHGGLAGAGQTDDGDELALFDLQADMLQTLGSIGIGFADILEFNSHMDSLLFPRKTGRL